MIYFLETIVEGFFFFLWNPNVRKEAQPSNTEKLAKDREQKLLSPSGRNNGSQFYEISKWALKKQMGSKEPEKREVVISKPMGSV